MAGRVTVEARTKRAYTSPTLVVYGAATKLTANGTKNSVESNGGTCGEIGNTKIRC